MIDKSLRYRYQWGGPGGKSPGTSPGHGQGNQGGGGRDFMPATTFTAPAKPAYVAPVTQRDVMPVIAPEPWEPVSPTKEYVAPIIHPEFDTSEQIEEQKEIIKEQVLKQKIADPTDELTTLGKEEVESFERAQDWDVVNELVDKGADFEDLNTLMDQGLLEKSSTQPFVRDFGQNTLVKSLMAEVKPKSGLLKTIGNVALGVLAPQLLAGTKLAKPYQLYRQYQTAKKYLPKGMTDTLAKKFKYTGPKKKIDTQEEATKKLVKHEPVDRDGIQKAVTGEDVISESIKKYTSLNDDQVNYIRAQLKGRDPEELRSILAQAKSRIESGEANQMEKDVFALVQEYLVDPTQYTAQGGRIDGPLMGGSRYI